MAKGAVLFQLDSRVADVQVEKSRQAVEFAQVAFELGHVMARAGARVTLLEGATWRMSATSPR